MISRIALLCAAWGLAAAQVLAADTPLLRSFVKLQLSDKFHAEGAHFGDFNRDGSQDVVAGPFWYAGPYYDAPREFRPAQAYDPKGYSDNFLTFVADFNQDQWPDIFVIDTPGVKGYWYENPKHQPGHWPKHLAFPVIDNESPEFGDLVGDPKPELIFNTDGYFGYATPNWGQPAEPWTFHPITPKGSYHKYTHGVGYGDLNGDGRKDFVEITGWWEQPASLEGDPVWTRHAFKFGDGGAQMLVYDVNGDGYHDVITCLDPHRYGLAWYEQVRNNGEISFKAHKLMGPTREDSPYGVKFTQIHAFYPIDMDGDGLLDFVTGKRWWAHAPPTDPESDAPSVLYWFRLVRHAADQSAEFVPYLIDDNSGVGTQVVAGDLNGDTLPDVVVSNKKGSFVFLQKVTPVTAEEFARAQPQRYRP